MPRTVWVVRAQTKSMSILQYLPPVGLYAIVVNDSTGVLLSP
jgi:hypothetical protein